VCFGERRKEWVGTFFVGGFSSSVRGDGVCLRGSLYVHCGRNWFFLVFLLELVVVPVLVFSSALFSRVVRGSNLGCLWGMGRFKIFFFFSRFGLGWGVWVGSQLGVLFLLQSSVM
jgi:hypothetical protein